MRVLVGLVLAGVLTAAPFVMSRAGAAPQTQGRQVDSLAALPAQLRAQVIETAAGEISDRGGPCNPGCVAKAGVPSTRFVSATLRDDDAVVTVEQGGIASFVRTIEFKRVGGIWKLAPEKAS
jgi:hypothetical protein